MRNTAEHRSIRNQCEAKSEIHFTQARRRNLINCQQTTNLVISDNHDDSIIKYKNMFGENMGGLEWKLPAAFAQWRHFAGRLPRFILTEAGNCSQRQSTGSIWRLQL
ncbi:hypothetical protein [Bradyrhizobium sp. DASA03007]|uniref:hypothetical protein n=1 Tax=unclassified Bradyrhizobium TaxID=2631580 RepID=UPI003F70B681